MTYVVYKIENTISGKVYIGITGKTAEERWLEHQYSALKRNSKYRLHQAIRKHGVEAFILTTVAKAFSKDEAIALEAKTICEHNSNKAGYNMNEGGTGLLYHTEESKLLMSERNFWRGKTRSGIDNPMFGRTHTDEARSSISQKMKGKQIRLGAVLSDETKSKISKKAKARYADGNHPCKGRKHTDEHRKRNSESKLGKVAWCKKYLVAFPDGHQEIVENLKKFCREHNLGSGNMTSVVKGRLPHHKRYKAAEIHNK